MNIRERLELRAIINLVIGIIDRLVRLFYKANEKFGPRPKNPDSPIKPDRRRPLKRVVDTIDDIIPLPWKNRK